MRLERGRDFEPDDLTLPTWFVRALMVGVWAAVIGGAAALAGLILLAVEVIAYLTGAW